MSRFLWFTVYIAETVSCVIGRKTAP